MKPNRTNYQAALYMRLSKDDGAGESASITTQRQMLHAYAKEHGFAVFNEYVDDGYSGTNFERPAFKRLIGDIEARKVNMVITKDLSRLGRDYIQTGQYTEIYFPSKGVRYIAVNDGYDSESPYTDIVPFKNVLNEMVARDTSRKIRSAFAARMQAGAFIGNFAPYGYRKDPADKHHLLPDPTAAAVVQDIFRQAAEGQTPTAIARCLNGQVIASPVVYRCANHEHLQVESYSHRQEWTAAGVSKILRNVVYLGHMAQGKTTKVSFKSRHTIVNPSQEWVVVENTHQPLVSEEMFGQARRRSASRACTKNGGFYNIFSGLAKCADCGRNMSTVGTRKKGSPANLACGGYKLYGSSECSNHFIDYNVLYDLVLQSLQEQVRLSEAERRELLRQLGQREQGKADDTARKRELRALRVREAELDKLVARLYEDHCQGELGSDRFRKLLARYEEESAANGRRIEALEAVASQQATATQRESYTKFSKLLDQYTDIQELTPDLLFQLIERIEVGQGHYEQTEQGRIKRQTVKIYFRFLAEAQAKQYYM